MKIFLEMVASLKSPLPLTREFILRAARAQPEEVS
jgi:hypothetical protein